MRFGLLNGKEVTADNVPRGVACGCICPECKGKLVACRGEVKVPYFSHYDLQECEGSDMTILHKIAENSFKEGDRFYIPELKYKDEMVEEGHYDIIQNVQTEISFGKVKPDVILTINNITYFIEIFVTHKVDKTKISKLNKLGYPVLEIDLSEFYKDFNDYTLHFNWEEKLKTILLNDSEFKKWCYHKYIYKRQKEDEQKEKDEQRRQLEQISDFYLSRRMCPVCPSHSRIYPPENNSDIIKCDTCHTEWSRTQLLKNPQMIGMWRKSLWYINNID